MTTLRLWEGDSVKILERRKLQKEFLANKQTADAGGLKITERRKLQKRQLEIISLLGLKAKAPAEKPGSRLNDLISGRFNEREPVPFIELVEEMVEAGEATLDQIKLPVVAYYNQRLSA